ncbi:YkgJ family cysteine cluster protein [Helicobacter baculiformis]|uniref:YkgJ family cysteine cluster protein n=1 Tax=Helicobacter baculiformis TaxID=427351 RepID=A0ABV7ZES2_9HELI|nr:YkgJ family cysteine cluster protein [Helicobacter baculiformis]
MNDSFSFKSEACASCGARCCIGTGYVFVSIAEIQEIATFLKMPLDHFGIHYLKRVGDAYSLLDQHMDKACVFLDMESKRCRIYPVRPKQCRTYPFWEHYKDAQEIACECPGIVLSTPRDA